ALAEGLSDAEAALAAVGAERSGALSRLTDARAEHSQRRAAAADIDRERASLDAAVESDQRRAAAMRKQLARLAAKAASNKSERELLAGQQHEAAREADTTRAGIGALEADIAGAEQSATRVGADKRALAQRVDELHQQQ